MEPFFRKTVTDLRACEEHLRTCKGARLQPSTAAQQDAARSDPDGEATEADDSWLRGHLASMARREREFMAWHDAHGAEREEQLATTLTRLLPDVRRRQRLEQKLGTFWESSHICDEV